MINYSLGKITEIVDGQLFGDPNLLINGIEIDNRLIKPGMLFVPIKGERVNGHDFVCDLQKLGVQASLWQKGEKNRPGNINCVEVVNVEEALNKLAKYYRHDIKAKFIGVTGSSGKTSTKDMIATLLQTKYKVHKTLGNQNNNIGVPRTILSANQDDDYVICEMGIDRIGDMDSLVEIVDPDITIITTIAPAHLEFFKDIDTIVSEKCKIVKQLKDGQCYYSSDAYGVKEELSKKNLVNKPISYGFTSEADYQAEEYKLNKNCSSFKLKEYPHIELEVNILGKQLINNLTGAICIALNEGVDINSIQEAIKSIEITSHRMEIKEIGQATIIDDCYNSNPTSLLAALELLSSLPNDYVKVACLGDMLELGPSSSKLHSEIGDLIDFSNFNNTLLYGNEMKSLYNNLQAKGIKCTHYQEIDDLYNDLRTFTNIKSFILVKASNGMGFINLVERLEEEHEN